MLTGIAYGVGRIDRNTIDQKTNGLSGASASSRSMSIDGLDQQDCITNSHREDPVLKDILDDASHHCLRPDRLDAARRCIGNFNI